MAAKMTAKVDASGRLTLPRRFREALAIEPGDEVALTVEGTSLVIQSARRENPFDVLAAHALEEYRAGHTQNLRAFAAAEGIDLDA